MESIKFAQDNEDFGEVLNEAKANPQVAADLAKDMLAAKTEEDVAMAIANAASRTLLDKTEGEAEKVAIQEQTTLSVRRIQTDIAVKRMEEELFADLDKATDVAQMDAIEEKIRVKADAWKLKVTTEIQET
jgi:hypothetical protein